MSALTSLPFFQRSMWTHKKSITTKGYICHATISATYKPDRNVNLCQSPLFVNKFWDRGSHLPPATKFWLFGTLLLPFNLELSLYLGHQAYFIHLVNFIKCLSCTMHCYRYWGINEKWRQNLYPQRALKKVTGDRNKENLHAMSDGAKCCEVGKIINGTEDVIGAAVLHTVIRKDLPNWCENIWTKTWGKWEGS